MSLALRFSALAEEDLIALHQWIESEAGGRSPTRISTVWRRSAGACDFPARGAPRTDIAERVRSIVFERRLIIFYRVEREFVLILRIVSGARDLTAVPID